MRVLSIGVLILWVLAGCSQEDPFSEIKQEARQFDLSKAPKIELVRDQNFMVGSYGLVNNIGDVAVDENGSVFVADKQRNRIQVFDTNGDHMGTLGQTGSDPGDLQNPGNLEVHGNRLFAFDKNMHRINTYRIDNLSVDGTVSLDVMSLLQEDSLQQAKPIRFEVLEDGSFLVAFRRVESPERQWNMYYRLNEEGKIIGEQLFSFKAKSLYVDDTMTNPVIMELPYAHETFVRATDDDTFLTLHTKDFLIRKLNSEGELLKANYYPMENRQLNKQDVIDLYTNVFYRRAIRGAKLPDTWPAVGKFLVDDEGRMWVAVITQDLQDYRWYVLEPSGEIAGTFVMPRSMEIMSIKNGRVYAKRFNSRRFSDEVLRLTIVEEGT